MKKSIKINIRIFYFLIGMIILSILLIFSFQWQLLPFKLVLFGNDITMYALPPILILISIFGSSLLKTSLTGKKGIDI